MQLNYKRSPAEIIEELNERRMALRASCAGYDEGNLWESKRLALASFILLHDGGRNAHSVLSQAGLLSGLSFLSTAKPEKMGGALLTMIKKDSFGATNEPFLDNSHVTGWNRVLPFSDWWNEAIFIAPDGSTLSRQKLVLSIRNQDGGGHYDGTLSNSEYVTLAKEGDSRYKYESLGQQLSVLRAHQASMRQIAYEIERTLTQLP